MRLRRARRAELRVEGLLATIRTSSTGLDRRSGPRSSTGARMIPTIQTLVFLLAVIALVAVVSGRTKIPPSILLVLPGVPLALLPGLPTLAIAPEFVLLVVLPPVICSP